MWNLRSIFLTADDASVTISSIVMFFPLRYPIARLTASLSMFGDCRETSRLSTFSTCKILFESMSSSEYEQNFALEPGESHLPSPASTTPLP